MLACAPAAVNNGSGGSNGKGGAGGNASGGSGGSASGGSGGSNSGGSAGSNSGGSNSGGSAKGGSGGSNSGGSAGSNSGGSNSGGSGGSSNKGGSGGSNSGGAAGNGGAAGSGGSNNGGAAGGGATGNGGAAGGGGSTTGVGGSTGGGATPTGWWKLSDWDVASPTWAGCAWTLVDNGTVTSGTSITPQDFTAGVTGGSYHVTGTVGADPKYESVAGLGFNIAEPISGDAKQCNYKASDGVTPGPPGVAPPSGPTGIAINWSQGKGSQFRIQIQAPDGSKKGEAGANSRWCATIKDAGGPSFVKFTDFYTQCWYVGDTTGKTPGNQYKGEVIDAVTFIVPGTTTAQPFDFTINGFGPGNSAADAPGAKSTTCTGVTGTLGGSGTTDLDYQRVKVKGSDCATYIVQNNNWGNPGGSDQTMSYAGNSFKVNTSTGNGSDAPASFPSVFQGRNGQVQNDAFDTVGTDNMPIQVSKIQSVQTQFTWSGGAGGKSFNAAWDVWFAASQPTPGSYNDAISGFVMVWQYKPSSKQPIGNIKTTATIAGHSWDVWVGTRGGSGSNSNAPVVSYVAKDGPLNDFTFDMNLFIKDAQGQGISSSWYLTDVFAGFEIWTGADGVGLEAKKVSIAVK